jgi:hypothetical protein
MDYSQNNSADTSPSITMDSDTAVKSLLQANTRDTFPWEKLPYEPREIIFLMVHQNKDRCRCIWGRIEPCLCICSTPVYFKQQRMMPALVVALRPLPASYQHVLQWLAKFNEHINSGESNAHNLNDMTKSELTVLKSVKVSVGFP